MDWQARIEHYLKETGYPRSLFLGEDGRVVGTWIMGNAYGVSSSYYGGYPAGYLRRMRALFPEKKTALHLFSGKVDTALFPGTTVDLNPDLKPDIVANAETLARMDLSAYDIVLADPPYSAEDSVHYGAPMVNRSRVLQALRSLRSGTPVVWLDQALPMYRKDEWRIAACIGMVKSTNHRFRVAIVFERQ